MQLETESVICQIIVCQDNDKGPTYLLFFNSETYQQKKAEISSQDNQTIFVGNPYLTLVSLHTYQQVQKKGMVEGCYRNPPPEANSSRTTPTCGAA